MSHERSETIQDQDTGRWVNVYGKGTAKAGKRLPKDESGVGHEDYDSPEAAAEAARKRSEAAGEAQKQFEDGFNKARPINGRKVPTPRSDRKPPPPTIGGVRG